MRQHDSLEIKKNYHIPTDSPSAIAIAITTMTDPTTTWLTLSLTDRQMLDLALLILYLIAIQLHSLFGWRRVYRVHRFSERHQRVYVVFSLRKVFALVREIVLDHVVFFACFALWVHGIFAPALAEREMSELQEAGVGEGERQFAVRVGLF